MSDKTDFTRAYIAWVEALKFTDDSPEAFEEVQRLAQVDLRVKYVLDYPEEEWATDVVYAILQGEWDLEVEEWHNPEVTGNPAIIVTAEDIEDVLKGPGVSISDLERVAEMGDSLD